MDEKTIYDPLRRKEVAHTPEEEVRQWFIGVLKDSAGVPGHMMNSEVGFTFGNAGKRYRADILIFGRNGEAAAVVECKRPEAELTPAVLEQALRYDLALSVKWIFITNGKKTFAARRDGESFNFVKQFPTYEEIDG